jgi:cytochrome P450
MAAVAAAGKTAERAALEEIVEIIGGQADEQGGSELFGRIVEAWRGEPGWRRGVALDAALIHVASMSNLAAALGWMLVDLITHTEEAAAVAAGDRDFAQLCALESTRLAQRSIMPRYVLQPVDLDTDEGTFRVSPAVTVAILLPLLNSSAGFEAWVPRRWNRSRLIDPPPVREVVTAFGHGKHSCPAQPFSLAAMSAAACRLLGAYELSAAWTGRPVPVPAQIGGVARAADPTPVAYRRRG